MFPNVNPKQSFPELELEVLKFWQENRIFHRSLEIRKDSEEFTFYDGPPFATGTPHYGHILAGVIKDVIPRYQTMKGKYVERRFGWDCHGLPIENIVEKKLGISGKKDIEEKIGVMKFNEECRANVFGYVEEWRKIVDRVGRWVDMDNDYKTMDATFMESVWWVFKQIYDKGLVYESYRVVPYCTRCSTPLSNFEVNQGYEDKQDKAVTVKFKIKGTESKYILAWTTTPWTLPSNLGLAVGTDIEYAEIRDNASGDTYILASDRVKTYYKNEEDYTLIKTYPGSCLVGHEYEPLFNDFVLLSESGGMAKGMEFEKNTYHVVPGHHVTTDSGTGVVHIAPAYGEDDYQIGKKEQLGFVHHIDAVGKTVGLLSNNDIYVFDFNDVVIKELKDRKSVVHIGTIDHSYPHCYRCHTPLIYRGISAWYVDVESLRENMLKNNDQVNWVPETIKYGRFGKWLEGARDWNISRNRYWGSAIPVWKSEDGETEVVIGSIKELYELNKEFGDIYEENGEYFYTNSKKPVDIHKHYVDEIRIKDPITGKTLKRIPEVLDCWFESGSMPYASKHYPFEGKATFDNNFPADFICEGLDQTRGWFYTLVVLASGLFSKPAFKNVIVNGIILAEDGRKMSKSLQNYPDPSLLLNKYGADALRFYLMNSPAVRAEDLRFSESGVEEVVKKVILPLWNTYSFFTTYANIDGWKPANTGINFVRHGETDTNMNGRLSDGTDNAPLNENGRNQARATGQALKKSGVKYDIIISSPLDRALQTAEIIALEIGHVEKVVIDDSLIERQAPKFSGKLHTEIVQEHFEKTGEKVELRHSNKIWTQDDSVESDQDFMDRVANWYDKTIEEFKGKNILVVAHGGVYRALNAHVNGFDYEEAFRSIQKLSNAEVAEIPAVRRINPLDRFIIGELETLVAKVSDGFDTYDLQRSTRAIVDFLDDLTNWYVRRSRRRFWTSEMDLDKTSAYDTLYRVLVDLTKVLAPFCPFVTDYVFKSLTGKESVHLELFPNFERTWVSPNLLSDMKKVKNLVTLGLALRSQKKIRVRQPLASVTIGLDLDPYYLDILKDELNVKEVIVTESSKIAKKICKPNARLIGPRFGASVQEIIKVAKEGNFSELSDGKIQVGEYVLESNEYEIAYEPFEIWAEVQGGFGMVIAMDAEVTEELKAEGFARDIVRLVQDARKEANYNVTDRIQISIMGDGVDAVVSKFQEYIESETLSTLTQLESGDIEKNEEIEDMKLKLVLKK